VEFVVAAEYLDIALRVFFERSGNGEIGENQRSEKCEDEPHCHVLL